MKQKLSEQECLDVSHIMMLTAEKEGTPDECSKIPESVKSSPVFGQQKREQFLQLKRLQKCSPAVRYSVIILYRVQKSQPSTGLFQKMDYAETKCQLLRSKHQESCVSTHCFVQVT